MHLLTTALTTLLAASFTATPAAVLAMPMPIPAEIQPTSVTIKLTDNIGQAWWGDFPFDTAVPLLQAPGIVPGTVFKEAFVTSETPYAYCDVNLAGIIGATITQKLTSPENHIYITPESTPDQIEIQCFAMPKVSPLFGWGARVRVGGTA